MKKPLLYIFPFLLLSSLAWAESELPECEGSPATDRAVSKKWTDCRGTFTFHTGEKFTGHVRNGIPCKSHAFLAFVGFDDDVIEASGSDKCGPGISVFLDGTKYEWKNGAPDNMESYQNKQKELFHEAMEKILKGKRSECEGSPTTDIPLTAKWTNCQGTMTWPDGVKYVGEWKDGLPNGQGTMTWPSGQKYVGEWKGGTQHGQGTLTLSNGAKYVGEHKDGKSHGQGTYTWLSGKKYVGQWKDNKSHGQGALVYPDGKIVKGIWKNDELFEVQ